MYPGFTVACNCMVLGERLVTHTGSSWGYTGMVSLLPDAGIAVHASVAGIGIFLFSTLIPIYYFLSKIFQERV